jgi:hypothetical protein
VARQGEGRGAQRSAGDTEIELLVESPGRLHGRHLLRASPNTAASHSERDVAVTLADQVGAALS